MEWLELLKEEKDKKYFINLYSKISNDLNKNKIIYPPSSLVFNAFKTTPFNEVKVIILGQDPYFSKGQAMGLAFSVPDKVKIPPSLRNIFKEIEEDLSIKCNDSGDLTRWAKQGVFLLNTTLTVREGEPNSHQSYGWKNFTAAALSKLNKDDRPKVFMLWGNNAKNLKFIISNPNHLVLEAAHPSPLSANRGFFGCKHFSKANKFLIEHNMSAVNWH